MTRPPHEGLGAELWRADAADQGRSKSGFHFADPQFCCRSRGTGRVRIHAAGRLADRRRWALTDAAAAGGAAGVGATGTAGLLHRFAIPDAVYVRTAGYLGFIATRSFTFSNRAANTVTDTLNQDGSAHELVVR
jgi:hypothetical protein